jgi:hypothetical protein
MNQHFGKANDSTRRTVGRVSAAGRRVTRYLTLYTSHLTHQVCRQTPAADRAAPLAGSCEPHWSVSRG